jgi:hypothetical protein
VYDEKTRPLIDFYRARALLRVINAEGDVDEVTRRLAAALGVPALRTPRRAAPSGRAGRKSPRAKPTRVRARSAPRRPAAARKAARRKSPGATGAARGKPAGAARRRAARKGRRR